VPRLVLLAGTVGIGLAVSACQAKPGAAAFVGSQRISESQLVSAVAQVTSSPAGAHVTFSPNELARRQLSFMINHDIVAAIAKQLGVTVSDGAVTAQLASFESSAGGLQALEQQAVQQIALAPGQLRSYVRDRLLVSAIGAKLIANRPVSQAELRATYLQQFVQVHAAHILVKDKATADRILAQVKAKPSSFAALAKQYSTDTGSKDSGGDLGTQSPAAYVKPFADAVATAPVGSFVEVQSQFGWHVVHVISRTATKSFQDALPQLRSADPALQQAEQQELQKVYTKISGQLHIRVSPRFGHWDPAKADVEPASALSTPAPGGGATTGPTGGVVPGQ
jgi:parvulin-like peptidyl-prolyl isomerase